MSFLNTETLKLRLPSIIEPFNENSVTNCSYELSLGSEYFVTTKKTKQPLKKKQQFVIPPGQFALLITKEIVKMPLDCLAFISIKYAFKKKGLINISGFHVDPGFHGKITFSVYNGGTKNIILEEGIPFFVIWLAYLNSETKDHYNGKHQNQDSLSYKEIMEVEGEPVSPSHLKSRIEYLNKEIKLHRTLFITIFSIILTIILTQNLKCNCTDWESKEYQRSNKDSVITK